MNERPTHLDLFSGIGGFALAAQWAGFRTIGFCEIDKYCQKVLAKNFGIYPNSNGSNGGSELRQQQEELAAQPYRICDDVFTLNGAEYRGVSLITGGFPCQPFSVAGKRRGAADDRAIWPEMFRVISEARPAWVLGENVPGIIPMELDNVLSDLESIGYATRPFVIPACAVDARHRRDRVWIIGRNLESYNDSTRRQDAQRCERQTEQDRREITLPKAFRSRLLNWLPEPNVGRVAHGIPSRVDRLKGLGNAIVPQVAYEILKVIYNEITREAFETHSRPHATTTDQSRV